MTEPRLFGRPYRTRRKIPRPIPRMNRWAIFTASLRDPFRIFIGTLLKPRGFAAAQCGEALPHRRAQLIGKEAAPPRVEAKPRRWKSKWTLSVSHRLTALCGGRAAKAKPRRNGRKLTT